MYAKEGKIPRDLIVFGEDWGAHPSSTQHLVKRLAKNRNVLWINSIGLRKPRLNGSDFRRLIMKLVALVDSGESPKGFEQTGLVEIVQPRAIPFPGNKWVRVVNKILLTRLIKPKIISAKLRNPVLWISLPTAVDVIGELGESAVVYYCGDDFGALAGVDHVPVLQLEKELAQKADLILAASSVIANKFNTTRTRVIPHGVDFELFSNAAPRAIDLPANGPVAGFYGSLADWLDIDLICETARRLPHWTFVLIGSVSTDISKLKEVSNIRLLGPRKHKDLPGYSQHWNVSFLPFRKTRQIWACNPLKLREYLAAGRPIISTEFPALDGYRDLISTVKTADEFSQALNDSLSDNASKRDDRRARVRNESWASRAQTVAQLIDSL